MAEEINTRDEKTRRFRWFREFYSIGGKRCSRNEKSDIITYVYIYTQVNKYTLYSMFRYRYFIANIFERFLP